jgi:hypothetical protein
MRNAKVELFDVALKGCDGCGLRIPNSTSATSVVATRCEFSNSNFGAIVRGMSKFNNCVFHDNEADGIRVSQSTKHLHGEATEIHSNKWDGISAYNFAKVIIHLPSYHNTTYNNGGQDRYTAVGGRKGTITNVEDEEENN